MQQPQQQPQPQQPQPLQPGTAPAPPPPLPMQALARPSPASAGAQAAAAPYTLHEDGGGIEIGGWHVRATRAPIIGDAAVEGALSALGGVLTVPEILFGDSRLELRHAASGVTLAFDALDALRAWRQEDLPPLKVSVAQQWQAARREEIERQAALVLEYDWTYTTPYQGTLEGAAGGAGGSDGGCDGVAPSQQQQHQQQQQQKQGQPLQGAASDDACAAGTQGSSNSGGAAAHVATASADNSGGWRQICTSLQAQPQSPMAAARAHAVAASAAGPAAPPPGATALPPTARAAAAISAAPGAMQARGPAFSSAPAPPAWVPTQHQADRALLLSRDEPILFFADVPLYESELDDNGVSALGVKVRVMPRCWLVLLRFWLRVDGALVRLRETRLFCRFDQPGSEGLVLRETKHFEGTAAQLRAAGAPVAPTAYSDGDAAAAMFSAVAPACLTRYELHELLLHGQGLGH